MSWKATALCFCLKEIIRFLIYSALLWGYFGLLLGEAFSQRNFLTQLAVSLNVFWDYGWAIWVLSGYGGILLLVIVLYLFDREELAKSRRELSKDVEGRATIRAKELTASFIAEKKTDIEKDQRTLGLYRTQLAEWDRELEEEQKKIDAWKTELKTLRDKGEFWKEQRQAIRGRVQTTIHVLEETPPNVQAALRHLKKVEKEPLRERERK